MQEAGVCLYKSLPNCVKCKTNDTFQKGTANSLMILRKSFFYVLPHQYFKCHTHFLFTHFSHLRSFLLSFECLCSPFLCAPQFILKGNLQRNKKGGTFRWWLFHKSSALWMGSMPYKVPGGPFYPFVFHHMRMKIQGWRQGLALSKHKHLNLRLSGLQKCEEISFCLL